MGMVTGGKEGTFSIKDYFLYPLVSDRDNNKIMGRKKHKN